jgi:hypothetical protein
LRYAVEERPDMETQCVTIAKLRSNARQSGEQAVWSQSVAYRGILRDKQNRTPKPHRKPSFDQCVGAMMICEDHKHGVRRADQLDRRIKKYRRAAFHAFEIQDTPVRVADDLR